MHAMLPYLPLGTYLTYVGTIVNLSLLFSYTYVCCWKMANKSFDPRISLKSSVFGRKKDFFSSTIYAGR